MTRSAHGLDSAPESGLWKQQALCGGLQADRWFATDMATRQVVAHICKRHCPVIEQCHADAEDAKARGVPPRTQVVAGMRRSSDGRAWEVDTSGVRCGHCLPTDVPPKIRAPRKRRSEPGAVVARRHARNLDLLHRLANGDTTAEIAAAHSLSIDTIKSHLRALYIEYGAKDRTHVVAIGYQLGLLKVEP